MTESDPGLAGEEISDAGTVGARRQEVGDPVPPGERLSLNLPPKELDAPSAGAGPGAPPPGVRQEARGGAEAPGAPGERRPAGTGGPVEGGDVEAVRRDIQEDRRRLGDTVEALVRKTDVRGRTRRRAARMGGELRRMGAGTAGVIVAAAAVLTLVAMRALGRRQGSGRGRTARRRNAPGLPVRRSGARGPGRPE